MGLFGGGIDPDTGDALSAGEMASRVVQRMIRRWIFLLLITAVSCWVWLVVDPVWRYGPAYSWNSFLSWLAVAIESVVGMFFFGQALRDAVVLRRILREITDKMERMEREQGEKLDRVLALVSGLAAGRPGRDPSTGRYRKRAA